ncbi:ABSCISIC ACID-INSENSITIVE 5-like protein 5 isoform X1 [Cucurbita moschata]|uniref:ABSCISIC ACID-INSENSITIVE 5-like protein 5 isoform X1 n=1 Tax=Cucurbita moschata TaxID=3662 RepID=A0A6J1GJ30_CUCMO|nr:ABSCISIC ACID-INSENSITIVE 5-like protein 5 isoform X1 [Cucurbita moschata]XP_022951924.1 ABSCISIC ACID-INSENSITIVE 5-like protein 5 isoform X1 [Cucurbita moschata]XP_022951925.1 ABSCISIC ACID-INSENSITIVE 5-like protein 5 isoform X1 [Cucurbita moschata]
MNFKDFGSDPSAGNGGGGGRPSANHPLARQSSIYSLTFDEFQSMGSIGKDFGSMNMDELLKNIWSAEEMQTMASSAAVVAVAAAAAKEGAGGVNGSGGYLQRQGSLTLPRTLSQKKVDEVWKDIMDEHGGSKDGSIVASGLQQRQQTLGEMTLEEFLLRAGVVREDTQLNGNPNNGGFFGNNNHIPIQSSNLLLNVNGVRAHQPQPIFPKQPTETTYGSQLPLSSDGIMGLADQRLSSNLMQGSALQGGRMGVVSLAAGAMPVATGSPANQLSSDGIGKSNGDTSSLSPVPYALNGVRGRRCNGTLDRVVERRQRRMIKNRESAARSRARKQAYTMELEAEVAKLKEENQELRQKQAEIMEMHKNRALKVMDTQQGTKKRCLRRTQTGPW